MKRDRTNVYKVPNILVNPQFHYQKRTPPMLREKKIARLAFRANKELLLAIEEEAEKQKTTMSEVMVEILSERLLLPSDPFDKIDRLLASL